MLEGGVKGVVALGGLSSKYIVGVYKIKITQNQNRET